MAKSVLASAPFKQLTLTHTTPGGWGTDPETGNPVLTPGETVELKATVTPDRAKQLQLQPGAEKQLTPVRCELMDPLVFPPGVGLGTELALTWAGKASTLKIDSITENDLVGVNFGTYFEGTVTPNDG